MSEDTKKILNKIKKYIIDGERSACEIFKSEDKFLTGKLSAYNDIYDYIEYVIEGED